MRFEDSIKNIARISISRVVRETGERENWQRC